MAVKSTYEDLQVSLVDPIVIQILPIQGTS